MSFFDKIDLCARVYIVHTAIWTESQRQSDIERSTHRDRVILRGQHTVIDKFPGDVSQ